MRMITFFDDHEKMSIILTMQKYTYDQQKNQMVKHDSYVLHFTPEMNQKNDTTFNTITLNQ